MTSSLFCIVVDVCSLEALSEMEVEFARRIQFLSSMIKKVTLRGTFPHCESHSLFVPLLYPLLY